MNEAAAFAQRYNDTADLMKALYAAGIPSEENWVLGMTTWTFGDDSVITVDGPAVFVNGTMLVKDNN